MEVIVEVTIDTLHVARKSIYPVDPRIQLFPFVEIIVPGPFTSAVPANESKVVARGRQINGQQRLVHDGVSHIVLSKQCMQIGISEPGLVSELYSEGVIPSEALRRTPQVSFSCSS